MLPYTYVPTVFIGPIPIQVWGFFVALGILVGTMLLATRLERAYKISKQSLYDLVLFVLLCAFLGARVSHVVLYEPAFFWAHPAEIIKVWHGGLSSYGGFIGAVLGLWWHFKKKGTAWLKQLPYRGFLDEALQFFLLAWMIGRMGCVMIHDHPGVLSDGPLAFSDPRGPRLDMAFLEIVGILPLGLFLLLTKKASFPPGKRTGMILMYYGILRFVLDFFRAVDVAHPDARYLGLTPAQYFSILMAMAGLVMIRKVRR